MTTSNHTMAPRHKPLLIELFGWSGIAARACVWHLIVATFGIHEDRDATLTVVAAKRRCKSLCVLKWSTSFIGPAHYPIIAQVLTGAMTAPQSCSALVHSFVCSATTHLAQHRIQESWLAWTQQARNEHAVSIWLLVGPAKPNVATWKLLHPGTL